MATPQILLYPNGHLFAVAEHVFNGTLWVPWDGSVSGIVTAAVTNDGTFAKETGGNLATIAGKDFATQTTLALIKAKTDNIPALGQALVAGSVPIVLTAAQLSTLTPPAAITGFATETTLADAEADLDTLAAIDFATRTGTILAAGTAIIGNIKDAGYQNTTWAVHHVPAANAQATITQASAGGSTKNVCLGFTGTICSSSTTAPAAIQLTLNLIDGSTGGTPYLWRSVVSLPAVAGAITSFNIRAPHGFEGSAATAMTIEFSAAGGANTIESVSMYGTTRL